MGKHGMTDQLARRLCRDLYEFTDGCPMEELCAIFGDGLKDQAAAWA
jgi:hypothetical protein